MKIAHLTSVHPRYDIRIFYKECKSLAKKGYFVSLVVKADSNETVDGVRILAIKEEVYRTRRFLYAPLAVYKQAIKCGADIFHFHDPELIPIGILLSVQGKKVIYDVHEDLPRQILNKEWIAPWLQYPVSWCAALIEWIASRLFFSAIVPATPKIARRFPLTKTVIVQNFPIINELRSEPVIPYHQRFANVIYVGGIGRIRGVIENIKALGFVHRRDCRLVLVGSYASNDLEKRCRRLKNWPSVVFKGWLSREEVHNALNNARIGLVTLHPTLAFIDSYPIKLFEYMSAGIPVIASNFPLWCKIIEGAHCGLLVDPMKPKEIAKAIDWLLDNPEQAEEMGQNGRRAVEERYNWSHEEKKLVELYNRLLT